ncbi:MAG TPA: tetratricopeptide repeat protein [Casimicrobiaceae bacterium]
MNEQETRLKRMLQDAQSLLARGDVARARAACESLIRNHPLHAEAHHFFAIVEYQRGDLDHALALIDQALSIESRNADFLNSRGIVLQTLGRLDDALASYDEALALAPRNPQVLYNRGIVLHATRRFDEALASYRKAIQIQPNYPEALVNQGNVLQALKRFDEALGSYNSALAKNPHLANGLVNRGIALQALNKPIEALASYDRALSIQASYPDALLNRGIALESLSRIDEALVEYERGLRLQPRSQALLLKRGDTLQDLGRVDEALASYRAVLALPTTNRDEEILRDRAIVEALWCERKSCAWDHLAESTANAALSLRAGTATPNPFISLCIFDDPQIQLDCARRYSADLARGSVPVLAKLHAKKERIRVGYLSGDLRDHATSYLLAGVFEAHNRSRFELRGYSYGPDDGSALRARLIRSFDAFNDVRALGDADLARRIAADDVDILVDLDGYTRRGRAPVVQFRPASVCVHYLGYPGTLGSPCVDYLIADAFVVPDGDEQFYSEAIARLPGCYQASEDKRAAPDSRQTRGDAGLPDDTFVFCAFNRPYKITPDVFDTWMRILRSVPDSVLWLLRDNERVETNLKREAAQRNIDPERLVFAPRVAHDEHLARHGFADLFLDTWPVCGHTTASDALEAGLPLITCPGRSFISRVSGSLLTAIGLPELIAPNIAAYEASAIALARDPRALAAVRERLIANRRTHSLFDAQRFCRNLEDAFEKMWDIACSGKPPRGFSVEERPGP